jgi:hypothetical protein
MFNSKAIKTEVFLLLLFLLTLMISCTKKSDETTKTDDKDKSELVALSNEDLNESDEDILTVDYKQFYDELAPSGEWIEVTGNDIGVDLKKSAASMESEHRKITLSELFGINDAYADDISFGSFFVWKPAPGLSVGVTAGEPAPSYEPYRNGQWMNTEAGWYFKAASEPEEITSHYGRWVYSPAAGWLWVPGRVWAPAWVDWREDENYIGWVPVPPSVYIVNNIVIMPPVPEERYYIVEKKYFVQPSVYKYMYKENKNKIMIKEWRRIDGVMVMNKTVINKGPDMKIIEQHSGHPVNVIKIKKVKNKGEVKYTESEISVLSPEFKKNKNKGNQKTTVNKPGKYVKFDEAKAEKDKSLEKTEETDKDKSSNKDKDKGKDDDKGKKEDKDKSKDNNKDKSKEKNDNGNKDDKSKGKNKLGDDSNMKDGKNKNNDKSDNDKGKQDKGNDKGKK